MHRIARSGVRLRGAQTLGYASSTCAKCSDSLSTSTRHAISSTTQDTSRSWLSKPSFPHSHEPLTSKSVGNMLQIGNLRTPTGVVHGPRNGHVARDRSCSAQAQAVLQRVGRVREALVSPMSKKSREQKKRKRAAEATTEAATPAETALPPAEALSKAAKRRAQKKRAQQQKAQAPPPPKQPKQPKQRSAAPSQRAALPVVYEDAYMLAINKPAGMVCHPCPGFWDRGTVVHALEGRERLPGYTPLDSEMLSARLGPTSECDSFIPRAIVHRLDRGTTGLLVVAKTAEAEVRP